MAERGLIVTRFRVSARDLSAIGARFRREDRLLQQNMRGAVGRFHRKVRDTTSITAPYRSGYMSRNVEIRFSKDKLSAETGWWRDTFQRDWAQTRGRFYPPYQELIWNPSLGPAYHRYVGSFVKEVKAAMQRSASRRGTA